LKERLQQEIEESYKTQVRAREAEDRARQEQDRAFQERHAALAKEMRLRKQMDLLENRVAESIAVEEREIADLEKEEGVNADGALLSPITWGALDDVPEDFWETPIPSLEALESAPGPS